MRTIHFGSPPRIVKYSGCFLAVVPLAALATAHPAAAQSTSVAAAGAARDQAAHASLWATFTTRAGQQPAPSGVANPTSLAGLGQASAPRYSVAQMQLPTRITLSMDGATLPVSAPGIRRAPVASYPLASTAPLVQTVAMTAGILQPVRPEATGSTVTHPASGAAKPVDVQHNERILFAQLESDLNRSQSALNHADQQISEGQQQLARWGDLLRQAMLEAGPDATGLHPFVRVAQRYAGTPYVWGGESRYGFDCSGFIMVVMRDLGYRALPHSAAEQFTYGTAIAQALLKPGDLVFFKNTYKPGISHVGIYLGHRRFIHAAGTGKGTIVSSLDDPARQAHYAGARRLIAARAG